MEILPGLLFPTLSIFARLKCGALRRVGVVGFGTPPAGSDVSGHSRRAYSRRTRPAASVWPWLPVRARW